MTTTQHAPSSTSRHEVINPPRTTKPPLRAGRRPWFLGPLLILSAVGGAYLFTSLPGSPQLLKDNNAPREPFTHTVAKHDLPIRVLTNGMLEDANAVRVESLVEGQVAIVSLLERGTQVRQGDVVVELDSSTLEKARMEQRVLLEQSRAATGQAKEAQQLALSQSESDVRAAELALRFAELDLKKYLEGDYPQMVRQINSEITLAEEELKRANDRIGHSNDLKKLGYLSEGQVDADRLMVLRSQVAVELAQEKKHVLENFTHVRMKQEQESKVDEARRSLERTKQRSQAIVEQAHTKLQAQQSTEELETAKLKHLDDQIAQCKLVAPQDGSVLYPMPEEEDQPPPIKHGALVHQRQHVFTIPSTDSLQVHATIHEAVVHLVKSGQNARISIEALPDLKLQGTTQEVSTLPDLQNWRKSTVNFYPTKILVDRGTITGLRPGMNAKVEIEIETIKDALVIPVQAVVHEAERAYCYVKSTDGQWEQRTLKLGKSNDSHIVVLHGLQEGETVVLSPDQVETPSTVVASASR